GLGCPTVSFDRSKPSGPWLMDYDFNEHGLEYASGNALGLGAYNFPLGPDPKTYYQVRESMVAAPSDMMAFADAFWRYSLRNQQLDVGYGFGGNGNDSGTDGVWGANGTQLARQRHNGRLNTVFCDGHVEGIKVDDLYFNNADS